MSSAVLAVGAAIVSMVSLGVMLSGSGGTFGPGVPVGWPNRFELAAYCMWFLTVAKYARGKPERTRAAG